MSRFNESNTEGYTQEQLDELNARFEAEAKNVDADDDSLQNLAERVQADFDTENS